MDGAWVDAGKGRFGQVYECFNLDSGEINAVKQVSKILTINQHVNFSLSLSLLLLFFSHSLSTFPQIPIQEKDSGALQTIVEEIQLFQKVQHENIVKFYGVELHHVRASIGYWNPSNKDTLIRTIPRVPATYRCVIDPMKQRSLPDEDTWLFQGCPL